MILDCEWILHLCIMRTWILLLILPFLITSCGGSKTENNLDASDYDQVEIKYAKNFNLKKSGDRFILQLHDPETNKISKEVAIQPDQNKRIISLTATLNGMICMLHERNRVIGVSSKAYLFDQQLKKRVDQGEIKEYGDITLLSLEKIIANNPNLILYDIVDKSFPYQEKLERLNVRVLPIYDWREEHPLAKAEWIKVVGAITGKYEEACEIFKEVEEAYLQIASTIALNSAERPLVMCGNVYGDVWYTPSGDNYFAKLINDAGGSYRYASSKGNKSLALPMEQILEENEETEFWLNPGMAKKNAILQVNPHAHLLKAWNENTFCYSANMNKFWEQSAARPDFVLEDLAQILQPSAAASKSAKFHYYKQVTE